jgi:deoxycytidylate deaminase
MKSLDPSCDSQNSRWASVPEYCLLPHWNHLDKNSPKIMLAGIVLVYNLPLMSSDNEKDLQVGLTFPEAELVFGLVYPVGTDYSGVQLTLENYVRRFNYAPNVIRLSEFIRRILSRINVGVDVDDKTEAGRINTLMTAGNRLCELAEDQAFIVSAAIAEINRNRGHGESPSAQEPLLRTAHMLFSLKRPREVELLRAIYGSGFYLIGIFATENERFQYLTKDKNIPRPKALGIMKRDEDENAPFGQRSRDTFQLSDVFISLGQERYKQQLERFLDLIFGNPFLTPEPDEQAMFLAYSASLRSAQLARQVGSAIRSATGDILATGCNDVPTAGGGLYWPGPEDARDHLLGFDSNDLEQTAIVRDLVKRLGLTLGYKEILKLLKNSRLMDISEYGRAVHAEMDALLTCARIGVSPVGGALFTTTFPCHNCTRHLIAAGIKQVIYIEPYPKSLASKLHRDSIELPGTHAFDKPSGRPRIPFEPFLGIGPRRFYDLFSMRLSAGYPIKRKREDGRISRWKRDECSPRIQMLPTSYTHRERLTAARCKATIDKLEEEQSGVQRLPFQGS